jgi:hypothetical protein
MNSDCPTEHYLTGLNYGEALCLLSYKNCLSIMETKFTHILQFTRGPKNNRNLNVACELEVVAGCAARCQEPRQYSSSLSLDVDLG